MATKRFVPPTTVNLNEILNVQLMNFKMSATPLNDCMLLALREACEQTAELCAKVALSQNCHIEAVKAIMEVKSKIV